MGSGHAQVVNITPGGYDFGETSTVPKYTPGTIHWEGDRGYMYYKSLDANEDGACMYLTGTAGAYSLQPVAVDTGQKVICVAVSDVASASYGWGQVYGPMTQVKRYTAIAVDALSYLVGVDDSEGCRGATEGSATYAAGVFGYALEAATTTSSWVQAYLTCL